MNIAILLSGRGSNFEAIAAAIKRGELSARIRFVGSNKSDTQGLQTAKEMGIPTVVFNRSEFEDGERFADFMLEKLGEFEIDLIALAGYLRKIPSRVVNRYRQRIVNVHPALLPKYGGKGMYGMNVHRLVIESGDAETGVTVHYVDDIYDNGKIIAQRKVPVNPGDTPEKLAARVLKVEHQFYPEVLQEIADNFKKNVRQ